MNTRIKVSLVLLLTLAAAVAYQWLGSASISITSEPTGAVVWIDGRARGKTPINRLAYRERANIIWRSPIVTLAHTPKG